MVHVQFALCVVWGFFENTLDNSANLCRNQQAVSRNGSFEGCSWLLDLNCFWGYTYLRSINFRLTYFVPKFSHQIIKDVVQLFRIQFCQPVEILQVHKILNLETFCCHWHSSRLPACELRKVFWRQCPCRRFQMDSRLLCRHWAKRWIRKTTKHCVCKEQFIT